MKFAVFAFLGGFCLVAVSAIAIVPQDSASIDDNFSGELDIEQLNFMNDIFGVLKTTLRGLKGINCSIKEAMRIKQSLLDFIDAVHACGGTVSKQMQALINECNSIISTCNDLINFNDNICNNGNYNEDTDGGKQASSNCFVKILENMSTLEQQISSAVAMISNIPTTGANASGCVNAAVKDLLTSFIQFPKNVWTCSKLTS